MKNRAIPANAPSKTSTWRSAGMRLSAKLWYTMTKIMDVYWSTIAFPTVVSWLA